MTVLQEMGEIRSAENLDDQIKSNVQFAVANCVRPAFPRVQVTVQHQHVVLHGEVSSYYGKQMVQVAAMSVAGVLSVNNAVVVQ